ncbi:FAD/NAD(P)-binding protein [Nocardioides mesophilus]|uniref:FAD/NAD(P)-binding protein n=1 Tax=Nocardioides mesophilus TaxID=433659 RepID=A0A7G9R6T1_9ACTN|nr:FAD/NAD(P)-binding protein [Nocardioides mesophilus]QNN51306.1 FAD/NAD(P)-binding protein [Nocardioides mesophilus]
MRRRRVLVVGGGAAGAIVAAALVREATEPLDVRIVERAATTGPGLAYRPGDPTLLLNNYAARMSAVEDDPGHLLRWCHAHGIPAGPHSFLRRDTYGRYLRELVPAPGPGDDARVTRLRGTVVGLADLSSAYVATLASGAQLTADDVVLALGNPPPRDVASYRQRATTYAADPWAPDLPERVRDGDRVLLVGTGLTAVDVALRLASAHRDVELVAVSRHGLLPLLHLDQPPAPVGPFPVVPSLTDLLERVRRERVRHPEGWRELVESLKLSANDQWSAWSPGDRGRFLAHAARRWETARHRMAPGVASRIESLRLEGRLRVGTPSLAQPSEVELVVNCTGPAPACSPGWSPLVDALLARGLARPGPHGLGLDVDRAGRLLDPAGRPARSVHVVGAARRGVEWEVAAVPDLRRQAGGVVRRLGRTVAGAGSLAG